MNHKLSDALFYLIKSSVIAIAFYIVASLLPMEKLTSDVTAALLRMCGIHAVSYEENGRIFLEYLSISIDCTALEIIAIFLGLILAASSTVPKKTGFALFISLAVFFVNVARIGIVYYLLEKGIPWWLAHDLFSGVLSIGAGMIFLLLSEHYLPSINQHLYTLLDAAESAIRSRTR
jgi:exosortase/archaeosortase family protein